MTRNDKLLERLKTKPSDFTYDELRKLLQSLDFVEMNGGKTAGSRVIFVHQTTRLILRLHRPHPGNELKMYQIREILRMIQLIGDD